MSPSPLPLATRTAEPARPSPLPHPEVVRRPKPGGVVHRPRPTSGRHALETFARRGAQPLRIA